MGVDRGEAARLLVITIEFYSYPLSEYTSSSSKREAMPESDITYQFPESYRLDEYAELAHRAVQAAEAMYPDSSCYAARGNMGCVPVLVETPKGEYLVVRYRQD